MSIGNLKDTGNQGNNLPYQWKVLQGLQAILDEVSLPLTCVDTVSLCFNDGVSDVTVSSTNPLPVNGTVAITGPLGVQSECDNAVSVALCQTQANFLSEIDTNTENIVTELTDVNLTLASILADTTTISNLDFATETTLEAVNTKLTSVVRTPTFLRPAGVNGTVAAGTFSMSFASVGTANAFVGAMILKPGETLNFDAGALNNTLGAVSYDTLTNPGAELIIITLT